MAVTNFIERIGSDNNTYLDSSYNDGVTPTLENTYKQALLVNNSVFDVLPVRIKGDLSLAESTYQHYSTLTHHYKKGEIRDGVTVYINDTIPETVTPIVCNNLPEHLKNWKVYNISTGVYDDLQEGTVNDSYLSTYAYQTGEIKAYGSWLNVHYVRVAIFVDGAYTFRSMLQGLEYNVDLSAKIGGSSIYDTSYGDTDYSYLSNNFKAVVDSEMYEPSANISPKEMYDGYWALLEFGTGDGCSVNIQGANPKPCYFGVFDSSKLLMGVEKVSGQYIPYYVYDYTNNVANYNCWKADALCRNVENYEKTYDSQPLNHMTNPITGYDRWYINENDNFIVNNDTTFLVSLVSKPRVKTWSSPQTASITYINVNGHPQQYVFMPGESCSVVTEQQSASQTYYTFDGWYDDNGTVLSTSTTYTISHVAYSQTIVARYTYSGPSNNVTIVLSYMGSNYLGGGSGVMSGTNVYYTVNGLNPTNVTNTPQTQFTVTTSDVVTLNAPFYAYMTVNNSSPRRCHFESFRACYGDDRDPVYDRGLGLQGVFPQGGRYEVQEIGSGNNLTEQLILSNLSAEAEYRIYAYYVQYNN